MSDVVHNEEAKVDGTVRAVLGAEIFGLKSLCCFTELRRV